MLVKDARFLGRTCLTLGRFSGELVKHGPKDCSRNWENKAARFRRADFQSWTKFAGKATARQGDPSEHGWWAVNVCGRNESPAAFQVVPASVHSSDVPSSCLALDLHIFCPLYLEHAPPWRGVRTCIHMCAGILTLVLMYTSLGQFLPSSGSQLGYCFPGKAFPHHLVDWMGFLCHMLPCCPWLYLCDMHLALGCCKDLCRSLGGQGTHFWCSQRPQHLTWPLLSSGCLVNVEWVFQESSSLLTVYMKMGFNFLKMELWESPALAYDMLHLSSLWSASFCVEQPLRHVVDSFLVREIGVIDSEVRVPWFTSWFCRLLTGQPSALALSV